MMNTIFYHQSFHRNLLFVLKRVLVVHCWSADSLQDDGTKTETSTTDMNISYSFGWLCRLWWERLYMKNLLDAIKVFLLCFISMRTFWYTDCRRTQLKFGLPLKQNLLKIYWKMFWFRSRNFEIKYERVEVF